jgi:hypothetical protein
LFAPACARATGKLDLSELQAYIDYSETRLGSQSPLSELYTSLTASVSARGVGSQLASFEEFVDLVRAQVAASEAAGGGWIKTQARGHIFPTLPL